MQNGLDCGQGRHLPYCTAFKKPVLALQSHQIKVPVGNTEQDFQYVLADVEGLERSFQLYKSYSLDTFHPLKKIPIEFDSS